MESLSEFLKKLSPLKVNFCETSPVKKIVCCCSKYNETINKNNKVLENVTTELSGVFDFDIVF